MTETSANNGEFIRSARLLLVAAVCMTAVGTFAQAAKDAEESARSYLRSGIGFLAQANPKAALDDFETILRSYPNSSVADDALLEIARYKFGIAREPAQFAEAYKYVKELTTKYPNADATAMGYVIEGQLTLMMDRSPDQINAALSSFQHVPNLFKDSKAEPVSMFQAGEALRLGGRRPEAIQRFSQLATTFPSSEYTPRALIGSALSLTAAGQWTRAMEQLQRVRNNFPRSAEASTALDLNTTLYRLYVRAPSSPNGVYQSTERPLGGTSGRLRDVVALAAALDNRILVATKNSVAAFDFKGVQVSVQAAAEPLSVFFDRFGRLLTVHEHDVRDAQGASIGLEPPINDGHVKELKLADGVMTGTGEYLMSDRDAKSILRFSAAKKFAGPWALKIDARRLAINDLDVVAALDGDSGGVLLFSRDGKPLGQIIKRTPKYQFRDPMDVTFDRFGHIYVLDSTAVYVFSPDGSTLLTTLTLPAKPKLEPVAFAVDAAARLYVFDKRTDTVQVFQ